VAGSVAGERHRRAATPRECPAGAELTASAASRPVARTGGVRTGATLSDCKLI